MLLELAGGERAELRILGRPDAPDSRRLRDYAVVRGLPFTFVDLDRDADALPVLENLGIGEEQLPVVVCCGAQVLRNPSDEELSAVVGRRGRGGPRAGAARRGPAGRADAQPGEAGGGRLSPA